MVPNAMRWAIQSCDAHHLLQLPVAQPLMVSNAYPETARYFKRVLQASQLPIGASGATIRTAGAIEGIRRQQFGKQLLDMIAEYVLSDYLWWLSRNYISVGLGTDADP